MATAHHAGAAQRPTNSGAHHRLQRDTQTAERDVSDVKRRAKPLLDFWTKVNNDWVSKFSDMLAFNFLTSLFPLLLVIVAIAGFVLGTFSHSAELQLQNTIASALPSGIGPTVIGGVLNNLNRSAGLVLILGILGALWTGSRLFIAIENCSGIVFRLRARDALHQNIMAILMTLLYVVLVPLVFGATALSSLVLRLVGLHSAVVGQLLGLAAGYLAAVVLFGAIYIVVPNRPVRPGEVWRGALLASALLVLYELLFPLYATHFLKPGNYGSVAGFAIVLLIFFYYLAFILLLGMEINSWAGGQRQTASDIVGIMHEVQAHNTTRGAAGPTAGTASEDIQNSKGAAAMSNDRAAIQHERHEHQDTAVPPKYAEVDRRDATAAPPNRGKDAPANVRRMVQQGGTDPNAPTSTTSVARQTMPRPTRVPAGASRRMPNDAQKVLLAAAIVGGGKLISSILDRQRSKKSRKS